LHSGVYAFMKGPQYETPAEIRALSLLGASAVGMSTVPEAIVASHCGIRVLGLSCISNLASGLSGHPLSHEEVIQTAELSARKTMDLIEALMWSDRFQ
jgi:purine-nucleoside phosphorylase